MSVKEDETRIGAQLWDLSSCQSKGRGCMGGFRAKLKVSCACLKNHWVADRQGEVTRSKVVLKRGGEILG